jgi:hypothetical protein
VIFGQKGPKKSGIFPKKSFFSTKYANFQHKTEKHWGFYSHEISANLCANNAKI